MLEHCEDYKDLHNAGLLSNSAVQQQSRIDTMSEPPSMYIEVEIFATSKVLQKSVLILEEEHIFFSRYDCNLAHSNQWKSRFQPLDIHEPPRLFSRTIWLTPDPINAFFCGKGAVGQSRLHSVPLFIALCKLAVQSVVTTE